MPPKYSLKITTKDKSVNEFVGSGFDGTYGVNISVNISKLFKIAKEHPELLKEYNGEKSIYIYTDINKPNDKPKSEPKPTYAVEELDDEVPW